MYACISGSLESGHISPLARVGDWWTPSLLLRLEVISPPGSTTHTMLFAFSICIENTANKKAFSIEYIEA